MDGNIKIHGHCVTPSFVLRAGPHDANQWQLLWAEKQYKLYKLKTVLQNDAINEPWRSSQLHNWFKAIIQYLAVDLELLTMDSHKGVVCKHSSGANIDNSALPLPCKTEGWPPQVTNS
jgi:hypothetical protein